MGLLSITLTLGLVLVVYTVSNLVQHEAGLLSVTIMGIVVGNMNLPGIGDLKRFKEYITIMLVSVVFVSLTADLDVGSLGAIGWRIGKDGPVWPVKDAQTGARYPDRRVRGVRECIEVLEMARSGKLVYAYDGEIFQITRPFQMGWAKADGPTIYGACSGPMMIRMGARLADAIQLSDFTPAMVPEASWGE